MADIGIVSGGHQSDPDPQKTGRVRVRVLGKMGASVKTEDLPFCQIITSSDHQHEFNRPPRPGQTVSVEKTGDHIWVVNGILHGKELENKAIPGNAGLDEIVPQIKKATQTLTGMRIPPKINSSKESNRTGLPKYIKKLEEKLEEDKHVLYNGIPTSGATKALAGIINSPVKQVSTALVEYSTNLTSGLLSQLPGQFFSMGNLLNSLSSPQQKSLLSNLPNELQGAFKNMMLLMSSDNISDLPGNFTFGGVVNPEKFFDKAIKNFEGVSTFGELEDAVSKTLISSFESSALDGLKSVSLLSGGVFGNITQEIDGLGNIVNTVEKLISLAESAFGDLFNAIPSGAEGENLFKGNKTIPKLINRLKDHEFAKLVKDGLEDKSIQKNEKREHLYKGKTVTQGHSVLGQI
jgi:hypothetical protein